MSTGLPDPGAVTQLLRALAAGERGAYETLLPLVHSELHAAAARLLRRERAGHTLQPTELVHEAWLRLAAGAAPDLNSRTHFIGIAARVMRQVLVDHARRRMAGKRGAGVTMQTLADQLATPAQPAQILALDEALERLAGFNARLHAVVQYRFFAGLEETEIATLLGVTTRTVQRDWATARAWLHQEIGRAMA
jgi:RNA polymerase sigma factor (TIGR02999 family)